MENTKLKVILTGATGMVGEGVKVMGGIGGLPIGRGIAKRKNGHVNQSLLENAERSAN